MSDHGAVTVTNSTFSGNNGRRGGVIYLTGGTLDVTDSTFSGNTASSSGGAIDNDAGTLNVTNTTFSNNTSGFDGGAIFAKLFLVRERNWCDERDQLHFFRQ